MEQRRPRAALTLLVVVLSAPTSRIASAALVDTPTGLPRASVSQDVGFTRLTVDYRSPALRGRALRDVAPPGERWLNVDGPQATLRVDGNIDVAGQPLTAGVYAIVLTPGPSSWLFAFETTDPARAKQVQPVATAIAVEPCEPREHLRVSFTSASPSLARLEVEWERIRLSVPIQIDTDARILAAIAALDRNDAQLSKTYADAARVLLSEPGAPDNGAKARGYLDHAAALADRTSTGDVAVPRLADLDPTNPIDAATTPAGPHERAVPHPQSQRARRTPSAREIGPVITRGRPTLQTCYQRVLRRDPSLAAGKVTVSINVGVFGRVSSVSVDGPTALRPVEDCVKSAVAGWVFPPSSEAYATQLPLVLDARN